MYRKCSFLFFSYASSLRHSMNCIEIKCHWVFFSLEFTMKSETTINNSILLSLLAALALAWNNKVCGGWNFTLPNLSVFPYILWGKYHPTPILLWQSYSLNIMALVGVGIISIFKLKYHYRSQWCWRKSCTKRTEPAQKIVVNELWWIITPSEWVNVCCTFYVHSAQQII